MHALHIKLAFCLPSITLYDCKQIFEVTTTQDVCTAGYLWLVYVCAFSFRNDLNMKFSFMNMRRHHV